MYFPLGIKHFLIKTSPTGLAGGFPFTFLFLYMHPHLKLAYDQAQKSLKEGGIPIGSILVHDGKVIGAGHNKRVQDGSVVLHGEMDALENAGRQPATVYQNCVLYTTLSPCPMCSGTVLLYGIPEVVIGENRTRVGE